MKTLDRNRAYGIVYGEPEAVFEQDGLMFDHKGNQVGGHVEEVARRGRPRKVEQATAIDDQVSAQ